MTMAAQTGNLTAICLGVVKTAMVALLADCDGGTLEATIPTSAPTMPWRGPAEIKEELAKDLGIKFLAKGIRRAKTLRGCGKRQERWRCSRTGGGVFTARIGWIGLGLACLASASWAWWLRTDLDPARLLTRAQADYRASRFEVAAAGLARLAHVRAPTPMDRLARALVARALGQDGLAELAQIPDDHPLAPQAHLLAGQIEVQLGRLRPAEAHFLATLAREPREAHAHRELAYIYNIQHRLREMDDQMDLLSELNALGFIHLLHWSKTRNAVWNPLPDCDLLAKYVAADPDDHYSRMALVDGLRRLGRLDEADLVLAPLFDHDHLTRTRRTLWALERGDTEQAQLLLSGGPVSHPALASARGLLALSRHDMGEAARQLRIAVANDPNDFAALSALAMALKILGDEPGAKDCQEALRRHTAITPLIARAATPSGESDPKLPACLGAACEAAGRLAEARAWYRLAIARDPLDWKSQQAVFRLSHRAAAHATAAPIGDRPLRHMAAAVQAR